MQSFTCLYIKLYINRNKAMKWPTKQELLNSGGVIIKLSHFMGYYYAERVDTYIILPILYVVVFAVLSTRCQDSQAP